MSDANLLSADGKHRKITPPLPDIALERYLVAKGETSILKAVTGSC